MIEANAGRELAAQIVDEPARSIDEVMASLAAMDVLVASRFHATVFAYLLGVPVLALSVDTRIDELMRDMHLPPFAVGIDDFDPEALLALFRSFLADREKIRARIQQEIDAFRPALRGQFDRVFVPGTTDAATERESLHTQLLTYPD